MPGAPDELPLIDSSHAGFITGAVTISVSSCGAGLMPSMARALGCRVSSDRHLVTLLVSKKQAESLLRHVRERGVLAVAFSEPASHRAIQLKGSDATCASASAADLQLATRYRAMLAQALSQQGLAPQLAEALLACPATELASISFSPSAAFSQTPGPNAGQALLVHA